MKDSRENLPTIRVSTGETGVLDVWRVSGVKEYSTGNPKLKLVYLNPPCVCKSCIISNIK